MTKRVFVLRFRAAPLNYLINLKTKASREHDGQYSG
jgi:hypothetical protein